MNEEGPVFSIQVTMAAGYTPPGNSLAGLLVSKVARRVAEDK